MRQLFINLLVILAITLGPSTQQFLSEKVSFIPLFFAGSALLIYYVLYLIAGHQRACARQQLSDGASELFEKEILYRVHSAVCLTVILGWAINCYYLWFAEQYAMELVILGGLFLALAIFSLYSLYKELKRYSLLLGACYDVCNDGYSFFLRKR